MRYLNSFIKPLDLKGKTEILAYFGSVARYPVYLSEFSKDTIKFLGVQFSINQLRELSAINWNKFLEKAETQVESYKKRRLSMIAKISLLSVTVFPLRILLEISCLHFISFRFFFVFLYRQMHFPSKMKILCFSNNLISSVDSQSPMIILRPIF